MSLESWKEEFYPVDAEEVGVEDAIWHSLNKWIKPENLAKHGLEMADPAKTWSTIWQIDDHSQRMNVSGDECALCACYHGDEDNDDEPCLNCPLAITRGGVPCDDSQEDEEHSPWKEWSSYRNPQPMIFWLTKTKEQFSKNA